MIHSVNLKFIRNSYELFLHLQFFLVSPLLHKHAALMKKEQQLINYFLSEGVIHFKNSILQVKLKSNKL